MVWADFSLNDWLETFRKLFSGRIHLQTLESIGFHLLEEAGEEAKAVRQLVQFRGVLGENIEGIDGAFLSRIALTPELVREYRTSIDTMKEISGSQNEREAKGAISLTTRDPRLRNRRG